MGLMKEVVVINEEGLLKCFHRGHFKNGQNVNIVKNIFYKEQIQK